MKKFCATSSIRKSPYRSKSRLNYFPLKPSATNRPPTKYQPNHCKKLSWAAKESFLTMKRPLFAKKQKSIIDLKKVYTNIFRNHSFNFVSQKAKTRKYCNKTIGNYADLSKIIYPNNGTDKIFNRRERSPPVPECVKRRRELYIKLVKQKMVEQDQPYILSFRNNKEILSEDEENNEQHKRIKEVSEGIFFIPNKTKHLPFLNEKEVNEVLNEAEVETPCFMKSSVAEK
eukprot:TRINITY_DN8170_c0_g1_i1.p1 TRINITY_DN8170_c0_g1~~TRINITY_DN8170_c0_g1_i1.p1  ORF type:complete len:229 (-),score=17.94 TRINITY_DN8170_c0_g1_i1:44-730(-)